MYLEEDKLKVAGALRHLERVLTNLVDALAHRAVDLDVDDSAAVYAAQARERVCDAYGTIDLRITDVPSQSVVCMGMVGVPPDLITLAHLVNAAKSQLRAVCVPLQRVKTRVVVTDGPRPRTKALPLIRVILRNLQRSDLNLLAAYRKIPVLDTAPASIVYTRARTRSVYRKSIEDIEAMLSTSDSPATLDDRARVRLLHPPELHLALVRDHYENVRANVTFPALPGSAPRRRLMAAELPLLYPQASGVAPPRIIYLERAPEGDSRPLRTRRSKLESTPYLQTLAAYRYLQRDTSAHQAGRN